MFKNPDNFRWSAGEIHTLWEDLSSFVDLELFQPGINAPAPQLTFGNIAWELSPWPS